MKKIMAILGLLTSTGTLVCCVLPAIIAAVAGTGLLFSIIDKVPFLVLLSQHKAIVFGVAGILTAINVYSLWFRVNKEVCPVDAKGACESGRKFAKVITVISIVVIAIGAYSAYF